MVISHTNPYKKGGPNSGILKRDGEQPIERFLGCECYTPTLESIYKGLGIPSHLVSPSGGAA